MESYNSNNNTITRYFSTRLWRVGLTDETVEKLAQCICDCPSIKCVFKITRICECVHACVALASMFACAHVYNYDFQ